LAVGAARMRAGSYIKSEQQHAGGFPHRRASELAGVCPSACGRLPVPDRVVGWQEAAGALRLPQAL